MLCPTCKTPLTMSERQGIEIDFCPSCRGVWLDRGELDKILERSAVGIATPSPTAAAPMAQPSGRAGHDDHYYRRKRRKSFLQELFD